MRARGSRRFSQAISEGERISVLAEVGDAETARSAEADGAEALVVAARAAGLREASELPILWRGRGSGAAEASDAGADAFVLAVEGLEDENGRLERRHEEALDLGLDCVVEVRDEDELRLALDRLDPEILLLSARAADDDDRLEHVLALLPDVPVGKLAIAELPPPGADALIELARAGIDAVIVGSPDVPALIAAVEL